MAFFPHITPFSVSEDVKSAGVRWKKWIKNFDNILIGHDITVPKRQRALLLSSAGEEVREIFDGLTDTGGADDYDIAVSKLNSYFVPKNNPEYEILVFRREKQEEGESVDAYHTRLRRMATLCEFDDVNKQIKLQIMETCHSKVLRTKALMNPDWTLEKLLETARMIALVADQTEKIGLNDGESTESSENSGTHIDAVSKTKHESANLGARPKIQYNRKNYDLPQKLCHFCGKNFPHFGGNRNCPARNSKCFNCGRIGHFGRCCRSGRDPNNSGGNRYQSDNGHSDMNRNRNSGPRVGAVEYSSDFDDSVFAMNGIPKHRLFVLIKVNNINIDFLVDTGAAVNVISREVFQKLDPKPELRQTDKPIFGFASEIPLKVLGVFKADVKYANNSLVSIFHVVECHGKHVFPLLGFDTCMKLNIISINLLETKSVTWKEQYPAVFSGIGKLKNFQIKLHIKEDEKPVSQKPRRVPYHLRQAVDKEIEDLLEQDIIEETRGPTPWLTPLVVVPKSGTDQVRLCLDMRIPNQSIERERCEMPTLEDVTTKISGAKIFSKLDLAKGYHQVELSPESRVITAFSTHRGLYRYKRLFFGINCAPEIFQRITGQLVADISGAEALQDDILIFAETREQHDEVLKKVLNRLQEHGLTLNERKCQFYLNSVRFYGEVLSNEGIKPDPEKVSAIRNSSNPTDAKDLRSFLGTTGYLMKFIPNYATLVDPLRQLVKKGARWEWGPSQELAVAELKQNLTRAATLKYFNPELETRIWVDASPVGLGAVLLQRGEKDNFFPVAYASRTLNPVERRYAQVEREALAVTWSCKKFHLYLVGKTFQVITDHRPLESIFNNKQSKPTIRIERMLLGLQEYDFSVTYRPGKENIADFLSRHPVDLPQETKELDIEDYAVAYVTDRVPKAVTLRELQKSSLEDKVISSVMKCIQGNKKMQHCSSWNNCEKEFFNGIMKVQQELTVVNGLLTKNQKLVIPLKLQENMIFLAHQGHQGLTKTKQLLRSKVWFPKLDSRVEKEVASCGICQTVGASQPHKDPLHMTDLPSEPWINIAMDFCGPLQGGGYLLVVIDEYSRYPVVIPVTTTSAEAVIPQIEKVFGMFGVPRVVKSDNGPPFSSHKFHKFCENFGVQHQRSTPRWPQANGVVERLMRPIKKVLQIAHVKRTDWRREMEIWLRCYRDTPHSTTGQAPFTMMFGRKMRGEIPHLNLEDSEVEEAEKRKEVMREMDRKNKEKMKIYADKKFKAEQNLLKIGMKVFLKRLNPRKQESLFDPEPWTISKINGTMITAVRGDARVTRNASFFKQFTKIFTKDLKSEESQFDHYDLWEEETQPQPNQQEERRDERRRPYNFRRMRRPPRRYIEEI